jgi:acyl-CoA thioesterase-1
LERVRWKVYERKSVNIYNYGVAGETTSRGLARFDAAIANKSGFVMLLMGVNDAVGIASGKGSIEATTENVRKMIEKAQDANRTLLWGPYNTFWSHQERSQRNNNSVIRDLNIAYKGLATSKGVKIADMNAVIKRPHLYADDVHPNRRGYYVMAMIWFDALNQEIVQNHLEAKVVQNYPSPADTFTKIGFTLSSASEVRVSLFNVYGQRLGIAFEDYRNAGYHVEEISTIKYPPGIYLVHFG